MSKCDEIWKDNAHRNQVQEECPNTESKCEESQDVRMMTWCSGESNKNLTTINDRLDYDKETTIMEKKEFEEGELKKVQEA